MRITKFKIDKDLANSVGLKSIDLTKKELGEVVALVGINGAGKSRILNFIQNNENNFLYNLFLRGYISKVPEYLIKPNNTPYLINGISLYVKKIDNDELTKIKDGFNFESMLNLDNQGIKQQNVNDLEMLFTKNTIQYIKKLTSKLAFEENRIISHNKRNSKEEKTIAELTEYKNYMKLKKYIQKMLSKEFDYEEDFENERISTRLYLDSKELNADNIVRLSPGQKTLFSYALLLYYYDIKFQTDVTENILILDEPEKHLHPEAQIKLIEALRSLIKSNGQLWIATHSVDIISHLNYEEIVMVENDEVILPSVNTPQKTLISLMGLEGHMETVGQFINSVNDWTYSNFMFQCFKNPEVILSNSPKDPQYKLFKDFFANTSGKKILDYGAGKGRLGYILNEDEDLKNKIEYYAFQRKIDIQEELKNVEGLKKIYTDEEPLPENFFDSVILCNVLHEITPFEWEMTLNEIRLSLKEGGFLVIIEDRFLPKGEKANYYGYLNLDVPQLKSLLSDDLITLELKDEKYKNRVVFVAANDFSVTHEKIVESLKLLNEQAYDEIKKLRENENIDPREARQYANLTQTFINSKIAIEDMGNLEKADHKRNIADILKKSES